MFSFLKPDPIKKLEKLYQKKLAESVKYQRKGDIETYSRLSFEADEIIKKIDEIKKTSK